MREIGAKMEIGLLREFLAFAECLKNIPDNANDIWRFDIEVWTWMDKDGWGARASIKGRDKWVRARGKNQEAAARNAIGKIKPKRLPSERD